ncbi:hypothetical protein [Streptomyces sp. cg36]|uniref:hypothetical protein n=1 Tax=Streptomyces sp. cg36 TaxID=3238798 RepID=UPI0034E28FDA
MSPLRTAAAPAATLTLTAPTAPREGERLSFRWSTDAPDPKNWIGIYDGDRRPGTGSSLVWSYVTTATGDLTLDGAALGEGVYTAYLLAKDGYGILAKTAPFTVAARPPVVRPYAVTDAFATGEYAPGERISVALAPLWIRPAGNPSGTPSFRRVSGDSWLNVGSDGTVTGTAPAHPGTHPGRVTVAVKDSAGGSDTVTVRVPVRRAGAGPRLAVASLNLWDAGAHIDGVQEKVLRLVLGARLDAVALQEAAGFPVEALARALGWHAWAAPAGTALLSRFPLEDTAAPVADTAALAATLRLPGGRKVRVWAAQLDEAGYGPYALRDGRSPAEVETAEAKSVRYRQTTALLAAMKQDLANRRTPVVLAAGLASPSHLDRAARPRWPVTVALAAAGLRDAHHEANPRQAREAAATWSPVRPDEPQDRIDQVQYAGPLRVESAYTLRTGWPRPVPDTAANGWPSDHAAPAVTFTLH